MPIFLGREYGLGGLGIGRVPSQGFIGLYKTMVFRV